MSLQSDKRLDNSVDKPCFFYNFDTKGQDLAPIDVKEATEEEVRKIRNRLVCVLEFLFSIFFYSLY